MGRRSGKDKGQGSNLCDLGSLCGHAFAKAIRRQRRHACHLSLQVISGGWGRREINRSKCKPHPKPVKEQGAAWFNPTNSPAPASNLHAGAPRSAQLSSAQLSKLTCASPSCSADAADPPWQSPRGRRSTCMLLTAPLASTRPTSPSPSPLFLFGVSCLCAPFLLSRLAVDVRMAKGYGRRWKGWARRVRHRGRLYLFFLCSFSVQSPLCHKVVIH